MSLRHRLARLEQAEAKWLSLEDDDLDDALLLAELRRRLGPNSTVEQEVAECERIRGGSRHPPD
jgi:hypothetical protein